MRTTKILFPSLLVFLVLSATAIAGDFGWIDDFNIQAQADPSGFRARLATRFNLGDVQVKAMLSNFDTPADAYITLRLGEISGRPESYVVDRYKKNKGKDWGALAKSLGIKPGSREFHALKQGNDLVGDSHKSHVRFSSYERKDTSNANSVDIDRGKERWKGNK